jgi:hypothetical protein
MSDRARIAESSKSEVDDKVGRLNDKIDQLMAKETELQEELI